MEVKVRRGDVIHVVHSEEQLALFLADGYEEVKAEKPAKAKAKTKE